MTGVLVFSESLAESDSLRANASLLYTVNLRRFRGQSHFAGESGSTRTPEHAVISQVVQ